MVATYDWVNYLKPHFKKVVGIKSHHHFEFSSDDLGLVVMREFSDSLPTTQMLLTAACPTSLPPLLQPKGLDTKRKAYLYKEIRDFCKEEVRDTVCPDPGCVPQMMDIPSVSSNSDSDENIAAGSSVMEEIRTSQSGRRRGRGCGRVAVRGRGHQASDSNVHASTPSVQAQLDSDSDYEPTEQTGRCGRGRGRNRGRGRGRGRGRQPGHRSVQL